MTHTVPKWKWWQDPRQDSWWGCLGTPFALIYLVAIVWCSLLLWWWVFQVLFLGR